MEKTFHPRAPISADRNSEPFILSFAERQKRKRPFSDVQTAPTGCGCVDVATGRGDFSRRSYLMEI